MTNEEQPSTTNPEGDLTTSQEDEIYDKNYIQKLVNSKHQMITLQSVHTKSDTIKNQSKRVYFNSIKTQFVACNSCLELLTYTKYPMSVNRHLEVTRPALKSNSSTLSNITHTGKINSHLFSTAKVPSDIKRELSNKAAIVCYKDIRTFNLFNGSGFRDYCQQLIDLGAVNGRLEYSKIGPDKKTVKNYTIKHSNEIKNLLIEHFKSIKTFVVSDQL